MATSYTEHLEQRTPYSPGGWDFLKQPRAAIVFPVDRGQIHLFANGDFRWHLTDIRENAVKIDVPGFQISWEIAMGEVHFNTRDRELYSREKTEMSAAFFEPDEVLRAELTKSLPEKGRERVLASTVNRLTASVAGLFYPSTEFVMNWAPPFVAYSTQEIWRINPDTRHTRPLIVEYVSTMAGIPEVTGRKMIGSPLFLYGYNVLQPDIIAFRVQNGAPVSALEKAGITEGPVYGVDEEWSADPVMRSLGSYFDKRTLHPNGIDMDRLIAVAVYPDGENKPYIHGKNPQGRAFEATEKLRRRGVDPRNGDGAYIAVWGRGKREQWEEKGRQRIFVVPSQVIQSSSAA